MVVESMASRLMFLVWRTESGINPVLHERHASRGAMPRRGMSSVDQPQTAPRTHHGHKLAEISLKLRNDELNKISYSQRVAVC
jgi:hypothetical protein